MKTFKKVLALLLVVALTATAAVNLTLAYLQDQDEDVNVMTLGNVYIEQNEKKQDGTDFKDDVPLYPAIGELEENADSFWTNNNVVDKLVSVTNTGESEAYVRTIFAFEKVSGLADLVHKNINETDWIWEKDVAEITIDGAVYTIWVATYPQALAVGATTPESLIQVALDKTAGNDYVNALGEKYKIPVVSQAIQTMGFADPVTALTEGFGVISATNHPWTNGLVGDNWEGSADAEGLEENTNPDAKTVEIYTPEQLKAFADAVNNGNTYSNYTVKLMSDINLNNVEWTPIGLNADSTNKFSGTFDGQGYTISNLKVDTEPGYTAAGLFGALNGTAKNLTIKNATISHISTGDPTDNGVAVVAGSIYNRGTIDNVHVVNATVNGNRYVGGISGYTYGTVTNCSVKDVKVVATPNELSAGSYDNGDKVGGIAGYFASEGIYSISGNTVTNATVVGYRDIGGVVGAGDAAAVKNNTVTNLTTLVDRTNFYGDKDENVGEIVGRVLSGAVDESNTSTGANALEYIADGLAKNTDGELCVSSGAGLSALNTQWATVANKQTVINITEDIDFTGYTWTPLESHADTQTALSEINGNGHTISNLTVNGQAMFKRFAGSGDVLIKDLTFDNATVNSNKINTSILTVHTYQNTTLDNVDVKNSTITGGYKVAPLVATVYNENENSTVTLTVKNCDVSDTVVKATSYDFCTAGMVAFVYEDDNDKVVFENSTVSNVTIIAPDDSYDAHAFVYTAGSGSLYNEANGVTVTNCVAMQEVSNGLSKDNNGNYYVYNAAGLSSLKTWMDSHSNNAFWGKTYNIMADIDASGVVWTTKMITPDSGNANGITFNGNGHTITGLTINGQGLFTGATKGRNGTAPATFKDITFDNVTVNGGSHHNGIIWGEAYGDITVDNVTVINSKVTGGCNVGAIIGRNFEHSVIKFIACSVKNTTVEATKDADHAGASAFLGMALNIGNSTSINLIFEGSNVAEGNTLTTAEGMQGGGIYTIATWGEATWDTPTVVATFTNYKSN